jgi:hypothetical protein
MKTFDSRHFLAVLFIILVLLVALSCEKKEEEPIKVKMNLPVITLGNPDTLSFEITSVVNIVKISLFDTANTWLDINSQTFGTTRQFELNVLYNPSTAGDKQFFLFVENYSSDNRSFDFTVNVIP